MSYKDNFDEFGNLRESAPAPWALPDLLICIALVGFLVCIFAGWI